MTAPPENATAAQLARRTAAQRNKDDERVDTPTTATAQDKLAEATARLKDLTGELKHLAVWREDLTERLWRAQIIRELIDFEYEPDGLVAEVQYFIAVSRALTASFAGADDLEQVAA